MKQVLESIMATRPNTGHQYLEIQIMSSRDSVNEMIKKNQRNKRGHELFQTVGTGKTAILMSFMLKNRRLCTYCVYSSPPVNAKSEFDRFGIPYVDMVTQSKKGSKSGKYKDAELVPFVINIIAHDQMRRDAVHAQLKHHAADMLFIVDEFHLATSATTIRSSIALEISKNAFDFVASQSFEMIILVILFNGLNRLSNSTSTVIII